ncbi:MAG: DUF2891 domain-containing protein [Pirellulaceae bacterium]
MLTRPFKTIVFCVTLISLTLTSGLTWAQEGSEPTEEQPAMKVPDIGQSLTDPQITAFAQLALSGMDTEYPNKPSNVLAGPGDVKSPAALHPAFYGCFDWHSSVHGHWMLARLLKLYPNASAAPQIRKALSQHLTADKLRKETEYFLQPYNKSFERMYGWAWYFRLVTELEGWADPEVKQWRSALRPLEDLLVQRVQDYLPKLQYPIRTGVHPNTAFALGQILDYAEATDREALAELVRQRSLDYYQADLDYPTRYEPSGEDFFSPAWNEVDLMRRILEPETFADWLGSFLPGLAQSEAGLLLLPVEVSDVTDGKIVHLAGLDLNRAWCLRGIAAALPKSDPRKTLLETSASEHVAKGLEYVFSGHYEGEHWLATFAVYALSEVAVPEARP